MIYSNLLYFLAAIVIYASAPSAARHNLPEAMNALAIILLILFFWRYNKQIFSITRAKYANGIIGAEEVKRYYSYRLNIHMILAIAIFAAAIYLFDLKVFLEAMLVTRSFETLNNALGLAFFMLLLSITWYSAHRSLGDILEMGKSPIDYTVSNIKFNLVIVFPWLLFCLILDLFQLINVPWLVAVRDTDLFQAVLLVFFLFIVAIFSPVFITLLWDCKPMPDSPLKESIEALCRAQGVTFRSIMRWGALNGSLVTAGVVGLIPLFRYLLITPQLERILNDEEIMAVISHEIAHVKKRHILFYFLFFAGFALLITVIGNYYFMNPGSGLELLLNAGLDIRFINFIITILMGLILILYFRFCFGYFMRNFERQADTYVFDTGIGPGPMISSFMKLGVEVGDNSKRKNWHHYNIAQRIGFIQECAADPGLIKQHNKKVKRSLIAFFSCLVLALVLTFAVFPPRTAAPIDEARIDKIFALIRALAQTSPAEVNLDQVNAIAGFYYALERWEKARQAYDLSLDLEYEQPEVLNNLAWLLVTCPDKTFLDPGLALILARDAVRLADPEEAHIYDTLAEAMAANNFFKEAVKAAQKALDIAKQKGLGNDRNDLQFYKDRLKEMKDRYLKSGMIKI